MKEWIVKNWILVIFAIAVLWFGGLGVGGCVEERKYKKEIRALDQDIIFLKQDLKKEAGKTRKALADAQLAKDEAKKARDEKEKHKARIAVIELEKKGLQEKIATLPPTEIVVHTVEILRVDPETDLADLDFEKEITLQEGGVLFTLVGARRNLEYLKGFSFVKKQYGELQLALAKSEKADKDTQAANVKLEEAVASQKIQIDKWPEIELKWDEKYKKSEKRVKTARGKGRKEGTVIGAIIATVLWAIFGK